jgi:type I restriction enzyme, S subunit
MQQLFPQPGETQPLLRFPEFRDAPDWDETQIGRACALKAGDFVPAAMIVEEHREGLFPCYGGNGLRGYVTSHTHSGRYVLVGRQGALCGNVMLCDGQFHATEHALVATPTTGIDVGWLLYALDALRLNRFAIGQAQPGLSVRVLDEVAISVPAELGEQQRIAGGLSSLDARIVEQSRRLDALNRHKQGLLQQLFPSPEQNDDH